MSSDTQTEHRKKSAAGLPAIVGGLCLAGCLAAPVLGAAAAGAVSSTLFGPLVAVGVAVVAIIVAIAVTRSHRRKASCGCGGRCEDAASS